MATIINHYKYSNTSKSKLTNEKILHRILLSLSLLTLLYTSSHRMNYASIVRYIACID
jgi:hypothetical protein